MTQNSQMQHDYTVLVRHRFAAWWYHRLSPATVDALRCLHFLFEWAVLPACWLLKHRRLMKRPEETRAFTAAHVALGPKDATAHNEAAF